MVCIVGSIAAEEAEAEALAPVDINLEVCIKRAGGAAAVTMQEK